MTTSKQTTTARPLVSVVLPIRNEAQTIRECLDAVLAQDYGRDHLEIIVAEGGSTDETRAILAEYAARGELRVVDNPRGIVPAGLNRAIAAARGEYIVRVDGHTFLAPDYISTCVATLAATGAANVGGPQKPEARTLLGSLVALVTSSPFGIGDSKFHYSDTPQWVDTVYLGAWPRSLFEQIGGFDESLVRNQDYEFNYRTRRAGRRIWYNPRIRSVYRPRESLRAFIRQYFQYGQWKAIVIRRHPASTRWRHLVAPVFVLALGGLGLLAPVWQGARRLLALVLALYTMAGLAESARLARRQGRWQALLLLPFFFILHVSWGSGFLMRLIQGDPTAQPQIATGFHAD
jgi:succinoglycan biosynthesis protein ExoA